MKHFDLIIIDPNDKRGWTDCQVAHNKWVIPAQQEFHQPQVVDAPKFAVGDQVRTEHGSVIGVVTEIDGGMVYVKSDRVDSFHESELEHYARPAKE